MENKKLNYLDFETPDVGFFERRGKKNFSGHPRLAKPILMAHGDGKEFHCTETMTPLSLDGNSALACHNAAFDILVGINGGLFTRDLIRKLEVHCTAMMARILRNNRSAKLKDLALTVLEKKEVTQYAEAKRSSVESFKEYAKMDARYTAELFPIFVKALQENRQWDLYHQIEIPFMLLNLECESTGFKVNSAGIAELERQLVEEIRAMKAAMPGESINWNSPKQVARKIFGELNCSLAFANGKISTSKKALKQIAADERVQAILTLKAREGVLRQLRSLKPFIDPAVEAIHPYINTIGADTGRCTSKFPNLQNVNKDSVLRSLFVACPDYSLVVLDFSCIEPRVLGHFLNPSSFARLFFSDLDFYENLAAKAFAYDCRGPPPRSIAKQVILATFYGMAAKTLGENLGIPSREASELLANFFAKYPEVAKFRDEQIVLARTRGYAEGLFNRRRYIEGLNSPQDKIRASAERQVLNAIIQGSATTIFKYKLVRLREKLPSSVRFVLHVHDEVILEAPSDLAQEIYFSAKAILEEPVPWFSIPIQVDGGIGSNWLEAKNNKETNER